MRGKHLLILLGLFLSSFSLFAQLTATQARHETPTQNQVVVTLSGNLAAAYNCTLPACLVNWSVTVGGPAATISSVIGAAGNNFVTISFTPVIGIGQAVIVNHTNDGIIGNIINLASQNNYVRTCDDFSFEALIGNSDPCAPVKPIEKMVFRVSLRARNSSFWNITNIGSRIDWGSGASFNQPVPYESDVSGNVAANTYFISIDAAPIPFTYPGNENVCGYTSGWRIRLFNAPAINCPINNPNQNVNYRSYNTDAAGEGNGALALQPTVPNTDLVCEGENVNMSFSDVSVLNCIDNVAAPPPFIPNQAERHVRVIYGMPHNAGNTIRNVFIMGQQITDANGDLMPAYAGTGFIPTTPNALGNPDGFGVVQFPALVTGPAGVLETITTSTPTLIGDAGRTFNITLQYWNLCNQYDGIGDIFNQRRQITDEIVVVTAPPQSTAVPREVCFGGTLPTFRTTGNAANATVNWYADNAGVRGAFITSNTATGGGQANLAATTGGVPNNTTPGDYFVWSSYIAPSGGVNCESPPVRTRVTVRNQLTTAMFGPIAGDNQVCNNTNDIPYSVPIAAPAQPFGGTTAYFWSANPTGGVNLDATAGQSITVDFNIAPQPNPSANRDIRTRLRYTANDYAGNNCESPNISRTVTVFGVTAGGNITPNNTICNGQSTGTLTLAGHRGTILRWERSYNAGAFVAIAGTAGLTTFSEIPGSGPGTYQYRAVLQNGVCAEANSTAATITVNPVPPQPTISQVGAGLIICADGSQTILQSSDVGGLAARYDWYRTTDLVNPVQSGVSNQLVLSTPAQSGSYVVRVVGIAPSDCASTLSDPVAVTIHPLPTVTGPTGGGAICAGNPAPDIVWTFTGTPPYDLQYTIDAVLQPPVNNHPTNTFTISAPLTVGVYELVFLQDANNCQPATLGGTASVTLGGTPPDITTFSAAAPVCDDGVATVAPPITINVTLDAFNTSAHNYRLTYRINGGSSIIYNFTVDGAGQHTLQPNYVTDLGGLPGTYNYEVLSLLNVTSGCISSPVFNTNVIINPRPSDPANPVGNIACSIDATGAPLSVDDPGAGNTVLWFSNPGLTVPAVGTTSGVRNQVFTPNSNATATYYAVIQSNTAPTNCRSVNAAAIVHTQDVLPTAASVGPDFSTCESTAVLSGSVPDNGGTGTWSVGTPFYYETFSSADNDVGAIGPIPIGTNTGVTAPASGNWTVDVSGGQLTDAADFLKVLNGRMVGQDVDGEVVWQSSLINIGGGPADIRLQIGRQGLMLGTEYIRAFYSIDAGPETYLSFEGGADADITGQTTPDGVLVDAFANGIVGTNLRIIVRMRNTAGTRRHLLDNVMVFASGDPSPPIISDVNDPNATVSNLPVGLVPTPTSFTWTITSALGVCAPSFAVQTITRNPLPVAVNLTPDVCEDSFGVDQATVDLTVYDADASDNEAFRAVAWFFDAGLTLPVPDPTNVLVNTTDTYHFRVTNTSVVLPQCVNQGSIVFTVIPLPEAVDPGIEFCEDFPVGLGQKNDVDLTAFNGNVIGAALPAERSVSWFQIDGVTPVPDPTDVDNVTSASNFIARVRNTITNCENDVVVPITINPRPINNPVIAPDGSTPGTVTLCRSNATLLFQIDPDFTPNSTYEWEVPTGPGQFVLFGGGTANDFFVLLRFPNEVVAPGLVLRVREYSDQGCVGNWNSINIIVDDSPAQPVIAGPNAVCTNEQNQVFNITAPVGGSTYTWNVPLSLGTIVSGQGTPSITVNMATTSGTITVIETSAAGCLSPPAAPFPVTVVNRPTVTSADNAQLCSGQIVSAVHTLTASIPGSTFNWEVISVTGPVGGANPGDIANDVLGINQTLTNTGGVAGIVTYRIAPVGPTTSGIRCTGPSQTLSITVNPEPVLVNPQTETICSGDAVNREILLIPVNLPVGTFFNWAVPVMSDASVQGTAGVNVPMGAAGTLHITDVLVNTGTTPITATYSITPTSGAGCAGTQRNIVITINPEPVGANDAFTVCSSNVLNYSLANNINTLGNTLSAGTTYSWVAAANPNVTGESTSPQSGAFINDQLRNVTSTNQVVVYTVTPTSSLGCVGAPFIITVTVQPEPVGVNQSPASFCSGGNVNYDLANNVATLGNNLPGTTFSWVAASNPNVNGESIVPQGTALINDVLTNLTNTNQTVIYTVTPTSPNGCDGTPFTITITVRPEPVGVDDSPAAICSGANVNYSLANNIATLGNNLVAGTTYSWRAVTVGPDITGASIAPVAGATINDVLVNLSNTVQQVAYEVTPTSGTACPGAIFTITITVNPQPVGVNDAPVAICSDNAVNYNLQNNIATLGNNLVAGTTYSWVAASNPNVSGESIVAQSGATITDVLRNVTAVDQVVIYTVTPTSAAGCAGAPFTITVTVQPQPVGINDTHLVCSDINVNYSLAANINAGNGLSAGTTYSWVAANNPNVTGESLTPQTGAFITDVLNNVTVVNQVVVYTVTPTSAAGCVGDPFTVTVTVQPEPVGANDSPPPICSDASVNYNLGNNIAILGNNLSGGTTYSWVAAANPNVTGESTTPQSGAVINDVLNNVTAVDQIVVYTVTPTSINGCAGNPFTITVTVRPEPVGINDTHIVCSDVNVNYDLAANINAGNGLSAGTTYTWVAANNPNVTGESLVPQSGAFINNIITNVTNVNQVVVYTVTPTSADGCVGNPFTVSVTVQPEPVGVNDNAPIVCSNDAVNYNLEDNVVNSGNGLAGSTFSWVAANNPNVTGESTTPQAGSTITDILRNVTNLDRVVVYTVTPTGANGCTGNNFTISVTVRPEPVGANDNPAPVCSDVAINYNLANNIATLGNNLAAGTTFLWRATADNPNVTGESLTDQSGTSITDVLTNTTNTDQVVVYTVTPTSVNGCEGDPFLITITVRPEPLGSNFSPPAICSDEPLNYDLNTNVTNIPATYSWVAANNPNVTGESLTPQSGNIISDAITNTTAINQVVVYTVTPTGTNGCIGNPFTITVTVRPEPIGSPQVIARCSEQNLGINLGVTGGSVPATNGYNLIAINNGGLVRASGTALPGDMGLAASTIFGDSWTNTGLSPVDVIYTFRPVSANACEGDNFTIRVTVNPMPVGTNTTATRCSDNAMGINILTNPASVAASTFTIAVNSNGMPQSAGTPSAGVNKLFNEIFDDRWTNITNAPLDVIYTITPFSASGCQGQDFTITVTINPEPVIDVPVINPTCSDVALNFTLNTVASSVVAANYNITNINNNGLIASAGAPAVGNGFAANVLEDDAWTNTTNGTVNVVYTVVPVSADGCLGDPVVLTFPIRPEPVLSAALNATVCSGLPTGVVLTTAAGSFAAATYNITNIVDNGLTDLSGTAIVGNGFGANAIQNHAWQNLTNASVQVVYTIVPVSADGCEGNPVNVTITVNPEPILNPSLNTTVCSDVPSGIVLGVNAGSVAAATYTIVSINTGGLTATAGNPVTGTNKGINEIADDAWRNTGNAPVNVVYSIRPVSASGCIGAQVDVVLTVNPEPVLDPGLNTTVCSNNASGIVLNTNGTSIGALTYNITNINNNGLTAVAGNPVTGTGFNANEISDDVWRNFGAVNVNVLYTIVPVSAPGDGGCLGKPVVVTLTVRPEPVLSTTLDRTVCSDNNIGLVLNTNGTSVAAANYNIISITPDGALVPDAGNVSPANGVTNNYLSNLRYTNTTASNLQVVIRVAPVSAAGCIGDEEDIIITIQPEPVLDPALDLTACSGLETGLVLNTNGVSVAAATYNVTNISVSGGLVPRVGNAIVANGVGASYLQNDAFTNTTSGPLNVNYTIRPVSAAGCLGDAVIVVLTVNPEPVINLGLNRTVCSDEVAGITLNTNGVSVVAADYDILNITVPAGLTPGAGNVAIANGVANNYIFSDTYENHTSTPLQVIYEVRGRSADGCFGANRNIILTVNPEPVINPALNATVCSDVASGIVLSTNGSSVAAASYSLISVNIAGGLTPAAGNATAGVSGVGSTYIVNDRFTNTTTGNLTVVYEVRAVSPQGCVSDIVFITLTVQPEPVLDPALNPAPVCSGVPSGVTLGVEAGSVAAASYNITGITYPAGLQPGGSNAVIGSGLPANVLINDVYVNTTNSPLNVVYTVVPVSAAGCLGDPQTVTLQIDPSPALAQLDKTVCSEEDSQIVLANAAGSAAAVQFDIMNITVGGGLTPGGGFNGAPRLTANVNEISADDFANNTNNTANVIYAIVPISAAGCRGPERDIVLRIEPKPVVIPNPATQAICSDTPTAVELNSSTVPSAGNITFNYTASASSGLITGFVPVLNNLANGHDIIDNLANNGDSPGTVTYLVTPVANGAKGGVGCSGDPVSVVINVEPRPKLVPSVPIQIVCEGAPTSVTLNSPTAPSAGSVEFLLNSVSQGGTAISGFSPVGTIFNPTNVLADVLANSATSPEKIIYSFIPRLPGVPGVCTGPAVNIEVTVNPLPVLTATTQDPICSGGFVNVTLTSDVTNTLPTWTVSSPAEVQGGANGAGSLIFQTLFNSSTSVQSVAYTVTPMANGCNGAAIVVNVDVHPIPKMTDLPPSVTICNQTDLEVPLSSDVTGTSFAWTVSNNANVTGQADGSGSTILQTLNNSAVFPGILTYSVVPTGPNNCVGTPGIMLVTVAPTVTGDWATPDLPICNGATQLMFMQFGGQGPFDVSYTDGEGVFNLDNVANFHAFQVSPSTTTTYTITSVTDVNGCNATPNETVTITVGDTSAEFEIVGDREACGPFAVDFRYDQVAGTTYRWRWFDGQPDSVYTATTTEAGKIVRHIFNNASPFGALDYNVTLTTSLPAAQGGCFDNKSQSVRVFPSIYLNVFPDKNQICGGETVAMFNQTVGANTHQWYYREQGTGQQIDQRNTMSASYTLNNTTAQNPIVYEIVYRGSNGNCNAERATPIDVYKNINAEFTITNQTEFIGGSASLTVTNISVPIDPAHFTYNWNFGTDANPASADLPGTVFNIVYSSPGVKQLSLEAVNEASRAAGLNCASRYVLTTNILMPALIAAFVASPVAACYPAELEIVENTSTGDRVEWQVVNEQGRVVATSNVFFPTFSIFNPGVYTIRLTTSNTLTGQVANAQQTDIEVYDLPMASFDARPKVLFLPDATLITFNFSQRANMYEWDFGDGGTSDRFQPEYTYSSEGNFEVKLIASFDHGNGVVCRDTVSQDVRVQEGGLAKVPNAFTPSKSGPSGGRPGVGTFNDVFLPIVRGVEEFNMQIFDRWGNLVFESNSADIGWDGYDRNGRLLPAGVYVFRLNLRLSNGQRTVRVGDVTLIR